MDDDHQKSRPAGAAFHSNNTPPNHNSDWSIIDHLSLRAAEDAASVAADRLIAVCHALGLSADDRLMVIAATAMAAKARADLLLVRRLVGGGR